MKEQRRVRLVDLQAQYRSIKPEIDRAVLDVLESGQFVLGPEVRQFEEEFAAYCRTRHAVGVNSGTSALHLACLAAGIGPGDEVITTAFTFVATIAAILYTGARPVLVDVEPATLTIDPSLIEAKMTPRTRAIVPVHLFGHPAAVDDITAIASRHGVMVIEDAAQAHGAEYRGRRAGSMGQLACFSFYPGKNLGAYGEGGAVTTNDEELARRIRMLRDWGCEQKYRHDLKGFNYRLDAIQGAILRVKLRHLDAWTEARRRLARAYRELLAPSGIELPIERDECRHVYHIYAVRSAERSALAAALTADRIETGIHYPIPVHQQPAYADLGYHRGDFPVAERAAETILSLPMYAELSPADQERVARSIQRGARNPVA
ncbi:MAG: DegT/DnrJ/EryC1/StrS family aminotransferase [Acidobacteria bacterium]|nr:DegT/DnrJ/EryC1/StrS family aminotransferase [Acidobacteriota bacterium]